VSHGAGLPAPVTRLFGRDDAIEEVCELLTRARLVTLTGPGGIGKTQLALAAAHRLSGRFTDGVLLVELATVISPDLVLPTIATAFGLWEATSELPEQRLKGFIADRHLLLVLDNAEHLLGAAPDIAALLAACAQLRIMVTSRSPLRLRGEHVFTVSTLVTPPDRQSLPITTLAGYSAIQLFVEQARASDTSFAMTDANAETIVAICNRLDGLPLALELAAARVQVLTPDALLARLDQQLTLLTGGPRDQPVRLRTMRNAIAWSYDLLDDGQQTLFRRLAVFSGGWTLDAANAVCQPENEVLEAMSSLIVSSLVRRIADPVGEDRFFMLEPIRQFALEQLVASGEIDAVRSRHADVFLALAEEAAPYLDWRGQPVWMNRLDREHDNFRAALAWLLARGDAERGLPLIAALSWFWNIRGFFLQTQTLAQAFLNLPGASGRTAARGRALGALAYPLYFLGDYAQAKALGEEALAINDETGDRAGRVRILMPLMMTAFETGDVRYHLRLANDLLTTARALGDQDNVARALTNLGKGALRDGDSRQARALSTEALELARRLENQGATALALITLGEVYFREGDLARAAANFRDSLIIDVDINKQYAIADGLERLAFVARACAQWQRSARLHAAAAARRAVIGVIVPASRRAASEADIAAIRAELGDEQFQSAWGSGHSMSLADAVAYALTTAPEQAAAQPPAAGNLSPRECDVLRLIAAGQSNKEIAADLYLSVRTVERHITNLYAKIGARGKADATAWALRHGID
jgi:non-specific serine/threonine protein kinase